MLESRRGITACLSTLFCTDTGQEFPGVTFRKNTATSATFIAGSAGGRKRHLGQAVVGTDPGGRHGIRHDRQYRRSRSSAQRRCGDPNQQAIGRSRGGLSTKIHALTDALGNPTRFLLTPGQAHDLVGSDVLLTDLSAGAVIADKTLTTGSFSL